MTSVKSKVSSKVWSAIVAFAAVFCCSTDASARLCPQPWKGAGGSDCVRREHRLDIQSNWTPLKKSVSVQIRSGYVPENPDVPFRGNVIYYQGLADSMVNQMPLFSRLADAGFRVISFDYMGQGGSSGSMNDTRIFEIPMLADQVYSLHARDSHLQPKKTVIGWSTGGLAAYVEAINYPNRIDRLVLIAPGIVPDLFVGEQMPLKLKFNRITERTLTSANYATGLIENPHLDPIKPASPLEVFTGFSVDLLHISGQYADNEFPPQVRGFALIGTDDSYVNSKKIVKVLKRRVVQFGKTFTAKIYRGARHEIQNEKPSIQKEALKDIVDFLTGARQPSS